MPEQHLEKRGQSMAYKLNVTEHADELLDNLVYHLVNRLKNKQAARHLLDSIDVIHLTRAEALDAWKVTLDQDYLILSENYVWEEAGSLKVTGTADTVIKVFPPLAVLPDGFEEKEMNGRFAVYERVHEEEQPTAEMQLVSEESEHAVCEVTVHYPEGFDRSARIAGRDTLLWLTYAGFGMEIFRGEEKINDHFYTGQRVPVSLGYFDFPERLTIRVKALHKDDWVFLEKWPELKGGRACGLVDISLTEEYR